MSNQGPRTNFTEDQLRDAHARYVGRVERISVICETMGCAESTLRKLFLARGWPTLFEVEGRPKRKWTPSKTKGHKLNGETFKKLAPHPLIWNQEMTECVVCGESQHPESWRD